MEMKTTSLAVSRKKGTTKTTVDTARLIPDHGFENDVHAGDRIMPREGVFARVVEGGVLKREDRIQLLMIMETPELIRNNTKPPLNRMLVL